MQTHRLRLLAALVALAAPFTLCAHAQQPTLAQLLSYPFIRHLTASPKGDRLAWVEVVRGVRNIWAAPASGGAPRQLTRSTADDGQELTGLVFTPDGAGLLYVRGGDHDANWDVEGHLPPDPGADAREPQVAIWSVAVDGVATPRTIAEGDEPAVSSKGELAYVKQGQVWTAALTGDPKPHRLFFDRGHARDLRWSPDGSRLAFTSGRGDHSFIGIYSGAAQPLEYLAPTTNYDSTPVWSPDSRSVAFVRQPSFGDNPPPFTVQTPQPFSLWTADAATGKGTRVWQAPDTLAGGLPDIGVDEPLFWMADGDLVFLAQPDNWPHLYAVPATGGAARLLTPGDFMVHFVAVDPDRRRIVYSANTGPAADDLDRRHLFVIEGAGAPKELTRGDCLEWSPLALAGGSTAWIAAGARKPAEIALRASDGRVAELDPENAAKNYPAAALVTPKLVSFRSADGFTVHGQLFRAADAKPGQPGIVFVHGGPPRQMLLGWSYMDYYANAYAVNQYLAAHGFTVLSVDYRLSIGYGERFQGPPHAGPAGASEYGDVLAGAKWLQQQPGVDAKRIGIWGGSYGGYLTGLALARNSDIFKAGVDFHGISNWIGQLSREGGLPAHWYDVDPIWRQAIAVAFASSPDADITRWTSPVLLIQGDDDRNVPFDQTVDLAHRLAEQHTPFEELVLPNEIHGFLRWVSWEQADTATVEFLTRQLRPVTP